MSFTLNYQPFPAPDGPLRYAHIPWDSQIYGFPCYVLHSANDTTEQFDTLIPAWFETLPTHTSCLVVTRIAPDQICLGHLLTRHNFYLVETQLAFTHPLARYTPSDEPANHAMHMRLANDADKPYLAAIARTVFTTDRFHLDPHLPDDTASHRYATWIHNAYRDSNPIYICEDSQQATIAGFIHARPDDQTIDFSLVAIAPAYQGKGIGLFMGHAVLTTCQQHGYQTATTRTSLNNLGGTNLYTRLGFSLHRATNILHWFRSGDRE